MLYIAVVGSKVIVFDAKQYLNSLGVGLFSCGQVSTQAQHLGCAVREPLPHAPDLRLLLGDSSFSESNVTAEVRGLSSDIALKETAAST